VDIPFGRFSLELLIGCFWKEKYVSNSTRTQATAHRGGSWLPLCDVMIYLSCKKYHNVTRTVSRIVEI
jgi:hypothetical protein